MDNNGNSTSNSLVAARLVCQLYRQFKYGSLPWAVTAGALNDTWIYQENKKRNITNDNSFPVLTDSVTGIEIDFAHMTAALASLLYFDQSISASGIQDLAGWAGDLLTGISDSIDSVKEYSSLRAAMEDHFGHDATKGSSRFGVADLMVDVDAVNIYVNFKNSTKSLYSIISDYYNDGNNTRRFKNYMINRFSDSSSKIESDTRNILSPEGTLALNAEYVAALATFKTYFNVFYESDQAILAASVYKDMIQKRLEN